MNLDSKTLLVLSIVLIIGALIGASAASVFADDPFKNIGDIDDDSFPVGFVDKIKVFRYAQIE
jgi:uncharacterized membrane protein YfcA